ncbi:MAG: MepB family protein [Firmicutes bacterium]|nr:MepB family protein [Bacillota bacterium]
MLENTEFTIFRKSKITPKKIGQFVTIYKRTNGFNMPFDSTDNFDFIVIEVVEGDYRGRFKFGKEVLIKNGVITHGETRGKMGLRLYPPWIKPAAKQAINSQKWQLPHFSP